MQVYKSSVLAFVALTLAASPVGAQDAQTVQFTPYVGLGTAGASPIGAAVTFPVTSALSVETDVAYRRGEGINALSTNASLLFFLPRVGKTRPYVAGGVGLAQYGAPVFAAAGGPPIGTEARLQLTANAGGGLKVPVSPKLELRTDARWFNSFGTGAEEFRVAQGISFDVRKR